MKSFLSFIFPVVFLLSISMTGCATPQRPYRDPLTYSFEGEAPPPGKTEWHDVKGKIEDTSKKIRSWEDRYLW